jgi:hypothetical protein
MILAAEAPSQMHECLHLHIRLERARHGSTCRLFCERSALAIIEAENG